MTIAVYPGAFDPVTNGHIDIAVRASKLFEKLVIGVFDRPSKNLLFSTEERVHMARTAVAGMPGIEVRSYIGLTVDFARQEGASAIVRGLRIGADVEREFSMALMNKKLAPDFELICLMANLKYQFVSSSLIKEVISLGGCIDDLVPQCVAEALMKRIHCLQ